MDEQSWWIKRPLQEDRLREALAAFEGEHDFRYLAKSRSIQQLSSTRRRILSVECLRRRHLYLNSASYFEIRIKGEGFLHQMVRRMVGFAVDFASGEDLSVLEILNPNKRTDLGRNSYSVAPAQALCLHRTSIEKNWYSPILNP
jgi:tRNA pseudouridine38-40 synthase